MSLWPGNVLCRNITEQCSNRCDIDTLGVLANFLNTISFDDVWLVLAIVDGDFVKSCILLCDSVVDGDEVVSDPDALQVVLSNIPHGD